MAPATLGGFNVGTNAGINALGKNLGLDYGGSDVMGQIMPWLATGLYPGAIGGAAFSSGLVPQQEQSLLQSIQMLSPGNVWNNTGAVRAGAMGGANDAASQLAAQLRSGGAGIGSRQGSIVQEDNNANSTANNYLSGLMSPQGMAGSANALQSLFQTGMSNPLLQQLLGMAGPMEARAQGNANQQQQNFQDSAVGQLGSLASGFSGGLSKKLFPQSSPQASPSSQSSPSRSDQGYPAMPDYMSGNGGSSPSFSGGTHTHYHFGGLSPNGLPTNGWGGTVGSSPAPQLGMMGSGWGSGDAGGTGYNPSIGGMAGFGQTWGGNAGSGG